VSEREPFFDSCDDFERGLLRSVRKDAPAGNALSKTIAALGLDQAALAASAGTQVAASSLGARSGSALMVVKGLAVGLVFGSAAMGIGGWFSQSASESGRTTTNALSDHAFDLATGSAPSRLAEPARTDSEETPAPAWHGRPKSTLGAQATAPRAALPAVASSLPVDPPSAPEVSSGARPVSGPAPSGSVGSESASAVSIAEQVKVIDQARSSLKRGRASEALGWVNAYVQRWPNGALTIEAAIVRIEAELALDDRHAAERDATALISALPNSRYATRVRALFSPPLAE